MMIIKIIFNIVTILISSNLFAFEQKPSIAVFTLNENKIYQSIKVSVSSQLNQNGFLTKNGNSFLKKISNSRFKSFQYIIENSIDDFFEVVFVYKISELLPHRFSGWSLC